MNTLVWATGLLCGFLALVVFSCAVLAGLLILGGHKLFWHLRGRRPALASTIAVNILTVLVMLAILGWGWTYGMQLSFFPKGPSQKPAVEDLARTWTMSPGAIGRMKEAGYAISTHTLTLLPDGTIKMVNMPDWWLYGGDNPRGTFFSASGTWNAEWDSGNRRWGLEVSFPAISGYPRSVRDSFDLVGEKPPYAILRYFGDPDGAPPFVAFERR